MENRFNLIDEPWIPVADQGRVSLRQIFSHPEYRSLGGNPVQKIALLKLLLAIAQAAATPKDEAEWKALGAEGLAKQCLAYLDQWHDRFYLYGEKPFLQMPSVLSIVESRTTARLASAKTKSKITEEISKGSPKYFGAGFYPDFPSANNTLLSHSMMDKKLSDSEKAIFIVSLMNFALGGKRVEAGMKSLGGQNMGAQYSAPAGPSIGGKYGYLHGLILTDSIQQDVWINLLCERDLLSLNRWNGKVGSAIWEKMPSTEIDEVSSSYKETYMSTLISLSRFVYLVDDGAYYLDGIKYPKVSDGWYEPTLIIDNKEHKAKYADVSKKPWRELDALLAFALDSSGRGYECFALRKGIERCRDSVPQFTIFIGGLRVSESSGDQSVKKDDDFVESCIRVHSDALGDGMVTQIKVEMDGLNRISSGLAVSVKNYFKIFTNWKKGDREPALVKLTANEAVSHFWQLCERDFQSLVDHCEQTDEAAAQRQKLRHRFAGYVHQAYDHFCPSETARQLDAWAKNRPNNSQYLKQEA